ncbi:hypothetical protein NM688_g6493 [Phlebia brevispora]|uniref:Uncharacterized protein n=1 Tax=Phlebia brevispora TaxID=194682 RepID=A0ACC1SFF9_9APHY|nr:hypothetical protein NM688_g6493 [Phlebia brevispora]
MWEVLELHLPAVFTDGKTPNANYVSIFTVPTPTLQCASRQTSLTTVTKRAGSLCTKMQQTISLVKSPLYSSVNAIRSHLAARATRLHVRSFASAIHNLASADPSSSTVNPDEVARFSKLSALWWDEHGECSQLHRMNPIRMQFIREKVVSTPSTSVYAVIPWVTHNTYTEPNALFYQKEELTKCTHTLDREKLPLKTTWTRCGGGLLCESLTRLGANTTGIDASSSNVQVAKLHAKTDPSLRLSSTDAPQNADSKGKGRLAYRHTSVEDLLAERGPNAFDIVCSMEVLEHVDNPRNFLSSCAQLVKPGGHLFLSTISRTALGYFLTIFMAEDALRLVDRGTHTFSKYIRPDELEAFFREYRAPSAVGALSRPWISGSGPPSRIEAERVGWYIYRGQADGSLLRGLQGGRRKLTIVSG